MKSMRLLIVAAAAAMPGCSRQSAADLLVGAWSLVSWEQRSASGDVSYPYGESPQGQIIYTANGEMSAQLMNPVGTLSGVAASGAEEIIARMSENYFAYYGTYTLDESARTVTHHVRGSLAPTWVGSDQVRAFEFLGHDRLQLTAIIDADDQLGEELPTGPQILVWARAE